MKDSYKAKAYSSMGDRSQKVENWNALQNLQADLKFANVLPLWVSWWESFQNSKLVFVSSLPSRLVSRFFPAVPFKALLSSSVYLRILFATLFVQESLLVGLSERNSQQALLLIQSHRGRVLVSMISFRDFLKLF